MRIAITLVFCAAALNGCTVIPPAEYARPAPPTPQPPTPQVPPPPPPRDYSPAPQQELPPPSDEAPLAYAALGQTVRVDGPNVTPLKVLEDSRCAMNARCVWAGQVRLSLRVGQEMMEITSGRPIRVADGTLELVQVRPDKMAGGDNHGAIPLDAYRFGFRFRGGY
ncbi:hypothetical protein WSK_0892 [Novosphingobium sp. Rr 2-17]|uniref:hypothetical protein n=1 Tax=Novosphingobium sp. Rr 2-17 TaxID=555793 RepID=UPI0002698E90|nr:hypothetical protein [Novosphingobium sp. Rr 2-17]EIZ80612.1 hypothetical protein WSK_0892 [Novosphingobium sp. Rr 2-17]